MKIFKIISAVLAIAIVIFILVEKESIINYFSPKAIEAPMVNVDHSFSNDSIQPYYQGKVLEFVQGGAYTYIEVEETTGLSFWIAVERIDVKEGDEIRFKNELVAKDFHSKTLDRVFDELMFASDVQYHVSE